MVDAAEEEMGTLERPLQQRRHLSGRGRLGPRNRRGDVGPRHAREPEGRLPRLQVRDPRAAPRGRRSDRQHGVVRRAHGAATPQIAYTASKGGVLAMTREIAIEFARRAFRVNALCPGPVDTPLLQRAVRDPARRARRMVHIPPGRLARADEIAQAALFLASDESSYVNGAAFTVDGGITRRVCDAGVGRRGSMPSREEDPPPRRGGPVEALGYTRQLLREMGASPASRSASRSSRSDGRRSFSSATG